MLFEITSSPQLSVVMLALLSFACYKTWDLGQVIAEAIVERWSK